MEGEKRKKVRRNFYQENRERLLGYQKERYHKLSSLFHGWKATLKCSRCELDEVACLDFHHCDPTQKETGVIRQISKGLQSVLIELKKCVVVCANCHRKVHYYKIPTESDTDDLAKRFYEFVLQHENDVT